MADIDALFDVSNDGEEAVDATTTKKRKKSVASSKKTSKSKSNGKKKPKKKRMRKETSASSPKTPVPVKTALDSAKDAAEKAATAVAAFTVEGGARKTKMRRTVAKDIEQSAEAASPRADSGSLPVLAAGMSRLTYDMPCLDGTFSLDDWTQRYRDSSAHTVSMETRQQSIADAIRASLRSEEEPAPADPKEPEPISEITIEDFFSGDLDTPLIGSARDMHAMLKQLHKEVESCEALSASASKETEPVRKRAKQADDRRRKRQKRKNNGVEPEDPDAGDDGVVIHGATRTKLEVCSRAYCAKYFREPRGEEFGERECARGRDCVFVMMAVRYPDTAVEATSEEGFICREFLLPSQELAWRTEGTLPDEKQLCLGCNRMLTTFYYYLYKARDEAPVELIQTHYNPVGDGEYDPARCLHPNPDSGKWTGIARPFIEFAPNTFVYVEYDITANTTGRKWNLLGVKEEMTDFRLSPSSYYRTDAEYAEMAANEAKGIFEDATTIPQDPRAAWVSGLRGIAPMRGVPPCRPLRPVEWIKSEAAMCPSPPGFHLATPLVPRLLLGQAFSTYAGFFFCPFEETLAWVRKNPGTANMGIFSKLANAPSMHSFDRSLLDAIMKDASLSVSENCDDQPTNTLRPRYKILLAILCRVEAATRLMGKGKDRRYDYWLQLFIDTHIDLCIAMHLSGVFDDATLEDPMSNPESVAESIYMQNYPHDTRCYTAGDLPDLSACVQFAGVWFQIRAKARAENITEALVHLIACKTQTHKCQVRNFASIAYGYAREFPQIMSLFRSLITISMLGNYPHAQHRPDFSARLHIAYSVRPGVSTDRELFLWIAENEDLTYGMVKEYYRYLVSLRPAFEAVLQETTHWGAVRHYICDAMDRARTVAGLSMGDGTLTGRLYSPQRPGYAGHGPESEYSGNTGNLIGGEKLLSQEAMLTIAADMKRLHEHSELPLITKLRKGTFSSIVVSEMSALFAHEILDDYSIKPQNSLISLAEIDGKDLAIEVVEAIRRVVYSRIPRRESKEPVEVRWLSYLGVTSQGVAALRALYYDYENKDIADNSIKARIRNIYKKSPRDFFVIHTYFNTIADWRSTASFELPLCYAESQSAVMRAKTFTPPWLPLPPQSDVFYWCPACLRWLSDTVDITDPTTRENMYSMNFNYTLYSHDTDSVYCDRQKVNTNTRKEVESGEYTSVESRLEDVKAARRIRHYLSTPACCSVPAVPVHMIGTCQRLGGKFWALCECCGALTQWGGDKFGSVGFSCGFHDADAPRNMTEHQKEELRLKRQREKAPLSDICSFCNNPIKAGDDYCQITVLDDCGEELPDPESTSGVKRTPPTWTYRTYALCRVDANAIRTTDSVLRLSNVERYVKRTREWRMKNAQKHYGGKI